MNFVVRNLLRLFGTDTQSRIGGGQHQSRRFEDEQRVHQPHRPWSVARITTPVTRLSI